MALKIASDNKLKKYRREFPFTKNVTFLNHASFGPIPLRALKKTKEYYDALSLKKIMDMDEATFGMMDKIRTYIAKMIKAKPSEIGLVPNTSYGLNIVSNGLDWKRGDKILLSEVEFPANVYPWLNLKSKGVVIKFIKSKNGFFDIDNLLEAIDSGCRLLSLSYVQFFNGFKNDLKTIGKICEEKNLFFVVDGIQGIGCLDLDVSKCKIDFLACGGQKWLLSSLGTGFFYLSEKAKMKIKPAFFGWLGVDWKMNWADLLKHNLKPFSSVRKFEIGTYPFSTLWTMCSSLELFSEIGLKAVEKKVLSLLDILIDYLQNSPIQIKSSLDPKHRSGILSFSTKDCSKLHELLSRKKILTSFRENSIRVSPHFYNSFEEIEKLIQVLKKLNNLTSFIR
ncbi:MAG: aminotransferase class V-fold PLP-dependent enzyme [candidate division Zixibacteria bacterium]|nr:aminotransferase class V-fold PLP-dependent enzyme [candidate division Zixibacteria bacterium]